MHNFNEKVTFSASDVNQMTQRTPLEKAAPDLLKVLRQMEWLPDDDIQGKLYCPWCGNYQESGHAGDCVRQAAIAKAEGSGPVRA